MGSHSPSVLVAQECAREAGEDKDSTEDSEARVDLGIELGRVGRGGCGCRMGRIRGARRGGEGRGGGDCDIDD